MSRTRTIVIKESHRHILSDEPSEYFDERGEQRFDRCRDCSDAVRLHTRDHAVQVKAAFVESANVFQRRVVCFRARERPGEQRGASILAHRIAQVLGYARTRALQGGADHLWFSLLPMSGVTGQ
jgi:hypothetical protein